MMIENFQDCNSWVNKILSWLLFFVTKNFSLYSRTTTVQHWTHNYCDSAFSCIISENIQRIYSDTEEADLTDDATETVTNEDVVNIEDDIETCSEIVKI